ncbi:MAG: phosphomannomutase/phosphoglucomutase [Gammaproteobacteria bacterium]|jgi:phosphomannomutase/phosphoglucomutase
MEIDPTIFRAYDIRGIADENLNVDVVRLIGQAIGSETLLAGEKTIFIARDGRLSGPKLSKALAQGILDSGCDVVDLGMTPTPVLYYATHIFDTHSGVMLTGSHNPVNYNGLKIVINGETLALDRIQKLYQRIKQNDLSSGVGNLRQYDLLSNYAQRISGDIRIKRRLKVIIDCGNGVGGVLLPDLYQNLGCDVDCLFCKIDGNFPNHHPDPSQVNNLKDLIAAVKHKHADIGLAFDGDCDRLGLVTNEGEVIWPDRELMVFAIDVLSRNPGAEIIYDVKCTSHLKDLILSYGGKPVMWKTGHSFIKEKMQAEKGALLAGEMSGHMFFRERWYGFDDAIYAGARLLEIVSQQDKTVAEMFRALPNSVNTPELRLAINDHEKFVFMDKFKQSAKFPDGEVNTLDGVRVDFPQYGGFGLIRPSNTTPYLILRFEANTQDELKTIQDMFRRELLQVNPNLKLPF